MLKCLIVFSDLGWKFHLTMIFANIGLWSDFVVVKTDVLESKMVVLFWSNLPYLEYEFCLSVFLLQSIVKLLLYWAIIIYWQVISERNVTISRIILSEILNRTSGNNLYFYKTKYLYSKRCICLSVPLTL